MRLIADWVIQVHLQIRRKKSKQSSEKNGQKLI